MLRIFRPLQTAVGVAPMLLLVECGGTRPAASRAPDTNASRAASAATASAAPTPVPSAVLEPRSAPTLRAGLEARPPPYAASLPRGGRDPQWAVRRLGLTITSAERELRFSNGTRVTIDPLAETRVEIAPDRRIAPRPLVWVHAATVRAGSPRHDAYSLYSETGKRLWFFEHDAMRDSNAVAYLRVADLNGDGIFEILAFTRTPDARTTGELRGRAYERVKDALVPIRYPAGEGWESPWSNSADRKSPLARAVFSAVPPAPPGIHTFDAGTVFAMGETDEVFAGDEVVDVVQGDGDDEGTPLTLALVGAASTQKPRLLARLLFGTVVQVNPPQGCEADFDGGRITITPHDAADGDTQRAFVVRWRSSRTELSSQAFSWNPTNSTLAAMGPAMVVANCDDHGFDLVVDGGAVHRVPKLLCDTGEPRCVGPR